MPAMRCRAARAPLALESLPTPEPGAGQILIKVRACGVCRTDLHIVDGELSGGKLPVTPGHEIVGIVAVRGAGTERYREGARVGVPWLGGTCGECAYCRSGAENLCERARFTGYDLDGGYAEYAIADARFCFPIPERYGDAEARRCFAPG